MVTWIASRGAYTVRSVVMTRGAQVPVPPLGVGGTHGVAVTWTMVLLEEAQPPSATSSQPHSSSQRRCCARATGPASIVVGQRTRYTSHSAASSFWFIEFFTCQSSQRQHLLIQRLQWLSA